MQIRGPLSWFSLNRGEVLEKVSELTSARSSKDRDPSQGEQHQGTKDQMREIQDHDLTEEKILEFLSKLNSHPSVKDTTLKFVHVLVGKKSVFQLLDSRQQVIKVLSLYEVHHLLQTHSKGGIVNRSA